jgi:effector-binding domain-containing protein
MTRILRTICLAAAIMFSAPVVLAQAPPGPTQPGDAFGLEVVMPEKTIVFMSSIAQWDSAFETLVDAFKTVYALLEREGIKPAGEAMVIYNSADDVGFEFQAAVPITESFKNPPRGDIAVGKTPPGKAFKFVHRGPYSAMDDTYEAITNFLDEKGIDAKDLFIEEYVTDPRTTPEEKLVINVLVPVH